MLYLKGRSLIDKFCNIYQHVSVIIFQNICNWEKCLFQVHFVLFSHDIYDIWLNKVDELLKD